MNAFKLWARCLACVKGSEMLAPILLSGKHFLASICWRHGGNTKLYITVIWVFLEHVCFYKFFWPISHMNSHGIVLQLLLNQQSWSPPEWAEEVIPGSTVWTGELVTREKQPQRSLRWLRTQDTHWGSVWTKTLYPRKQDEVLRYIKVTHHWPSLSYNELLYRGTHLILCAVLRHSIF